MMRLPRLRVAFFGVVLVVLTWLVASPVRTQSAPPQILVVLNSAAPNPFGTFLPEILRAEGIKTFSTVQLASVDALTLSSAELVVLAETPLTGPQATLFNNYVATGGRLVAMRPDAQLGAALGVTREATSTTDGYLAINQSVATGAGLAAMTLPVKGTTTHYTPAGGATTLATLYSTRTTPTAYPAVVRFNSTVTFAFDLGRAVAYARQGDPANANVNYSLPALQSFDMFFTGFDAQRMRVPFADVEMRLFSRSIRDLLADELPLPALWYFPSARRALMLVAGDAHFSDVGPYNDLLTTAESFGARVTLFLTRWLSYPTGAAVANWRSRGHEVSMHPYGIEDGLTLAQGFQRILDYFGTAGWGAPSPTVRSHQIEWLGWTDAADVAAAYGARLDLNHYSFGPSVQQPDGTQGMGYITGSGLPMRFIRPNGTLVPVYGHATTFIDHQLFGITVYSDTLTSAQALARTTSVMGESLADYHTVMSTQFHVDYYTWSQVRAWADGTMQYAQANNIPMWTGQRWLAYTEARDATTLTNVSWALGSRQLQFTVTVPAGAEAQTVMVPVSYGGETLQQVRVNGSTTTVTTQTVNGRAMGMFSVAPFAGGSAVIATYSTTTPSLSVNDVSVVEGTGGVNNATFTVTMSPASASTVTVNYATANGTAVAPGDYTATSGTLTFTAGQTSRTISVPLVTDGVDEPSEAFTLALSNPSNASIGDGTGVATIVNDDAVVPVVNINDVSVTEGNAGTTAATFNVTLSAPTTATVTVNWATANGTATAGTDYTAASGTLTFAAGVTSQPVMVSVLGDTAVEPNETFTVTLTAPSGATLGDASGQGTIVNDDVVVPAISINDVSVTEGNTGTTTANFTVSLSAATTTTVTVGWATANGTATAGSDYTAGSGTLTFPAGTTTQPVVVTVFGDTTSEVNETFTVNLTSPVNATLADGVGVGTILNDDAVLSTLSINDVSVTEGNTGTATATFTITLAPASAGTVTVNWATANDTATAGADYTTASGTVTFTPGATTRPVAVSVLGDSVFEPNETFTVNLTAPVNAAIADGTGIGTILNDDAPPPTAGLIAAYAFDEGTGTTTADRSGNGLTLTLTSGPTWTTSGRYGNGVTLDGVNDRLVGPSFTLPATFTYMAWVLSPTTAPYEALITVGSNRDLYLEGHVVRFYTGNEDRSFGTAMSTGVWHHVALTSDGTTLRAYLDGAALGTAQAGATTAVTAPLQLGAWLDGGTSSDFFGGTLDEVRIYNRALSLAEIQTDLTTPISSVPVVPTLSINDVSVTEGNAGTTAATFAVTLSAATTTTVTVNWATANGTATAGTDYTAGSGTLTFPAGTTTQPVAVTVLGDTAAEANETFTVNLTSPVNATLADGTGVGTILNDDAVLPTLNINDVSVTEGNTGTTTATFTVTLAPASASTVTVAWATANGTATAGTDYTAGSGTLTFPAGSTTQPVAVTVLGETTVEPNETFSVNLSSPTNATIADGTGVGTIVNDDTAPPSTGLLAAYAFDEGSGTTTADRSGNGVTLTLTDGPTWTTSGRYGNGVTLDGINDRLVGPSFTLPGTFTVMAWVLSPTAAPYETMVSVGSNRDVYLASHVTSFYQGTAEIPFGAAMSAGVWHHIALTSDGTTIRAYLDGAVLGTPQTLALGSVAGALQLGALSLSGTNYDFLGGTMDEVRIYNRALSLAEIQTDLATPIGTP